MSKCLKQDFGCFTHVLVCVTLPELSISLTRWDKRAKNRSREVVVSFSCTLGVHVDSIYQARPSLTLTFLEGEKWSGLALYPGSSPFFGGGAWVRG